MQKKASETVQYTASAGSPVIGTVSRRILCQDGLFFKDIDGSGNVTAVNDWRKSPQERAEAYVKILTPEEKMGQLFISQARMGIYAHTPNPLYAQRGIPAEPKTDETGLLDEAEFQMKSIFGSQILPGTTDAIQKLWQRYFILRDNPAPNDLADWINQLQATAEACPHFVPALVLSNSRNENGELVFGMNDAAGVFAAWPGTLGIAAAVLGDGIHITDEWADCIRREWDAVGMKKGYMYMADVLTDPRWQRSYGTFGEDPALISEILEHIIPRIQGSDEGVTSDGIALTIKHFPGGGARENGFDPHYQAGQWNVYPTKGSLETYHLPPFQKAVDCNAASIMPYYAKPAAGKSAPQTDRNGASMEMQPYGFAYNEPFIGKLLREQMGFTGYINSDTGILHNMAWGVEQLDLPERVGFAVNHTGTDIISGMPDVELAKEAYARASNGYYETHPIPDGFTKEDLTLTDAALDQAVTRTLTSLFQLGVFENPYRDPENAVKAVAAPADWANAADAHRKSVVLLKNDGTLPLSSGKKVYAEAFCKQSENAAAATKALRELLGGMALTDDPSQADYALLMLTPSSGEYFSATPGYLELDICDGKIVCNVDEEGRPAAETHLETTLSGANRIPEIADAVHAHGGKVIAHVNVTLPWMLGNVEPYADALTVGFDTFSDAVLDILLGRFAPSGKLPVTLPRNDQVLAVDQNGVCISPNDVPGYAKDRYMPDSLKDENGRAYAYRDSAGNYYELNFGLTY
ncbi:MAG: glycoside hydrolase family 3 N-terminal domain-containing protein [Eubacteriales bacterium]|nr:glycoside hydrolase family 3 N-terminal domain-containing protein [Eubacteriales bacterium]